MTGEGLPSIRTAPPGPASRALARRLAAVESRNITHISPDAAPIFWTRARGANVEDADGNVYVDLTGGFAVAAAGHANERVATAIADQAVRLAHGLGDVHPPEIKVRLLERIAALAPGDLSISILGCAGAEAVEAALKTAVLATGRSGVVAFRGGYHGLTYGALAATWLPGFREPFASQLFRGVRFAPFPAGDVAAADAVAAVAALIDDAASSDWPVGAVLVEPIQGRGGIVVPPDDFLPRLRELCDARGVLLVLDEIYTGVGRTGRWFACEHTGVVPDVLVLGKALAGSLPLSAAVGTPAVMQAWPPSTGEAIHTSTFLGNPIACAAALAHLDEIDSRGLVGRAAGAGARLGERLRSWRGRFAVVHDVRGIGMLWGVELTAPDSGRPATAAATQIVAAALAEGVLILSEGAEANVLAFTPPLVITDAQLDVALTVIETALSRL